MMIGRNNHAKDRISELPDALITYILSFLDTIYAVQTSALSKRWKTQWTSVTTLCFQDSSFSRATAFRHFIEQAVFRRNSSFGLDKFVILSSRTISPELYENLINYATANGVKHLEVDVQFNNKNMMSPVLKSIYFSVTLRTLKLRTRQFIEIATPFYSEHLEVLHLQGFTFSEPNVLSKCQNLVELRIIFCNCRSARNLIISGPELSRLTLIYTPEEIVLSAPKLSELYVNDFGLILALQTDDELAFLTTVRLALCSSYTISNVENCILWSKVLMNTIQKFHFAQHVSLSRQVVELLYVVGGTMEVLPFSFPNLKTMTFITEDKFDKDKPIVGALTQTAPQISIPLNVLNKFSNHILRDSPLAKLLMEVRKTNY